MSWVTIDILTATDPVDGVVPSRTWQVHGETGEMREVSSHRLETVSDRDRTVRLALGETITPVNEVRRIASARPHARSTFDLAPAKRAEFARGFESLSEVQRELFFEVLGNGTRLLGALAAAQRLAPAD